MLILRMSVAFADLQKKVGCLEERQRRFSRVVSITETIDSDLPFGGLPAACVHEVKSASLASALAFCGILSKRFAGSSGNIVFVSSDRSIYPLGLTAYGNKLNQILLVFVRRPSASAWAVLEALRCSQVSSVVADLSGLDLTSSRRLQLAAETSGATALLIGNSASAPIASAVTRWKISPIPTHAGWRFDEPVWSLELLYCRNGRPGNWTIEWKNQSLKTAASSASFALPLPVTA